MKQRIDYMTVAPGAYKALGGVHGYVAHSGLESTLVELVNLRVSQINGCAYCLGSHTGDLIKKGVSPMNLALVQAWREAGPLFGKREQAALAWAESLTLVIATRAADEDFKAVSAVFSEKEIVDLTVAIGLMNTFNRIAIGFRRPPEAALEPWSDAG